jgi:hypothetical protein
MRRLILPIIYLTLFSAELMAKEAVSAFSLTPAQIKKLSPDQAYKLHRAIVSFLIQADAEELKEYSYLKSILRQLTPISSAHAYTLKHGTLCFIGGYPSMVFGSKCAYPDSFREGHKRDYLFKNKKGENLTKKFALGTYKHGNKCDKKGKFHCNPNIFGEGVCVSYGKKGNRYKNLTTKCDMVALQKIEGTNSKINVQDYSKDKSYIEKYRNEKIKARFDQNSTEIQGLLNGISKFCDSTDGKYDACKTLKLLRFDQTPAQDVAKTQTTTPETPAEPTPAATTQEGESQDIFKLCAKFKSKMSAENKVKLDELIISVTGDKCITYDSAPDNGQITELNSEMDQIAQEATLENIKKAIEADIQNNKRIIKDLKIGIENSSTEEEKEEKEENREKIKKLEALVKKQTEAFKSANNDGEKIVQAYLEDPDLTKELGEIIKVGGIDEKLRNGMMALVCKGLQAKPNQAKQCSELADKLPKVKIKGEFFDFDVKVNFSLRDDQKQKYEDLKNTADSEIYWMKCDKKDPLSECSKLSGKEVEEGTVIEVEKTTKSGYITLGYKVKDGEKACPLGEPYTARACSGDNCKEEKEDEESEYSPSYDDMAPLRRGQMRPGQAPMPTRLDPTGIDIGAGYN